MPKKLRPMTAAAFADNRLTVPVEEQARQVPTAWQPALAAAAEGLARAARHVRSRLEAGATIYPSRVFKALDYAEPRDVRVVILGQDPYHGPGQAMGLSFSVPDGCKRPPSLRNIFNELALEFPDLHGGACAARPADGAAQGSLALSPGSPAAVPASPASPAAAPGNDLTRWAEQGVLLLNTVLTVEDGQPASHAKQGWEAVTDALIALVARDPQPKVFMLWGAHAQAKQALLPPGCGHLVLAANHPSPLSARRPPVPFLGCGHFADANRWLAGQGRRPVDWS